MLRVLLGFSLKINYSVLDTSTAIETFVMASLLIMKTLGVILKLPRSLFIANSEKGGVVSIGRDKDPRFALNLIHDGYEA